MTFKELGVSEEILNAIDELGFAYPMPIQEAVIPFLLEKKDNLIALAQTGTGKTAAYGIPTLQGLENICDAPSALILSPTRELCLQIADDLSGFSKYMHGIHVVPVYGGTGIDQQIRALRRGCQIIVATPGRLIDLKNRGFANLENVRTIVLDEADEMLNMGFQESITEIMESLPADCRKLLFSATMGREVEKVAKNYISDHEEIVVGSRNEGAENVNHVYYLVHAKDKYLALKRIVDFYPKIYGIVFCRTKLETQEVADKLIKDGYNAESLHGDLSQPQRDQTMQKFRRHTIQLLVATDVAARGLDVNDLTHVINYGMPDDTESYTHRSGRTGRAGKKGTSISIIHTKEKFKVHNVEKIIGKKFVDGDLPTPQEICTKQLYKSMDDIMKMDVDEEQIAPFMDEISRHFEYADKEDIIKKIVSMTFGRFLDYYAKAPVIEKPKTGRAERSGGRREKKSARSVEAGYERLFINLGKDNGFYPGEVMQFLNKHLGGRQRVGHIDLYGKFAYIEIPKDDAENVMASINGTFYRGIEVRCNPSEDKSAAPEKSSRRSRSDERGGGRQSRGSGRSKREERYEGSDKRRAAFSAMTDATSARRGRRGAARQEKQEESGDWRQFFRGSEPDFTEEGWARRKPKKK